MRIALLQPPLCGDSRPDDLDTLVQAQSVAKALEGLGHTCLWATLGPDLDKGAEALARLDPDLVFNLVESLSGSDALAWLAPDMLERLAIPFTGCGSRAMRLSSHKLEAKKILRQAGIPTPAWIEAPAQASPAPHGQCAWIIKSATEHASLGLDAGCVLETDETALLMEEMRKRREAHGGQWFAEAYVRGREFSLTILEERGGPKAMPPAEMLFLDWEPGAPTLLGYEAKWSTGSTSYRRTVRTFDHAPEEGPLLDRLARTARDCWDAFGLAGYARVDFRVDASGRPLVIDVNANPCLSPDAGFVAALERQGLSYPRAVAAIIRAAAVHMPGEA